ncbi:MAG: BON domain-containing protein [Alphaproteobacteria bacterium]|nr:BON domain-containing protein [Alphaproteobacteria bacterium]
MTILRLFTCMALCAGVGGCVPLVAGGAAATGMTIAKEKSVGSAVDDAVIQAEINHNYIQSNVDNLFTNIETRVDEGRVLLTGKVPTDQGALEAVRLAWKVKGVKEVINELKVTDQSSVRDYAKDAWISTQIKSKMLFEKNLKSINYSIETINQEVYLFGIAQDQRELDKALTIARTVSGVKKVINHVILKDDPRRNERAVTTSSPRESQPSPAESPSYPTEPVVRPLDSIDAR